MEKNMKKIVQVLLGIAMVIGAGMQVVMAQKIDEERMNRDIAVAENVLGTLIKQQFNNQRTFFPLEIKGSYQAGYGVTFRLPADYTVPIAFSIAGGNEDMVILGGERSGVRTYNYSFDFDEDRQRSEGRRPALAGDKSLRLKDQSLERQRLDMDSVRDAYNLKVIEAAKTFLVDYGDMITQLGPQEKVIVSNQGNQPRMWVGQYFNAPKRTHLSVEAIKSDLSQFRQGKISRDQALAKITVVNTQTVDAVEPDLELLSSIFSRLYSQDLSKTYFTGDNIYFEHLKDFGVIYYMQVYSAIERGDYSRRFVMPTLGLNDVDQETRDKKVKELYPAFESELKDNILEYGRTLKTLQDNELLVFQVALTKCSGCAIPATLEISLKASVLKEFNAGKIDRKAAAARFSVKKGENQ
jgi:hypothetical protein